jgi:hypothetical protein
MRKILGLLIYALVAFHGSGQSSENISESNPYHQAVKVNVNFQKTFKKADFHLGDLAPVFLIRTKRNNFHEIEWNSLTFDNDEFRTYDSQGNLIAGNKHSLLDIGIRYQYTRSLVKNGRLIPQLGISYLAQFTANDNQALVSTSYDRRTDTWTEHVSLAPQLRYNFQNRLFVDVAYPIELFNLEYFRQKVENPAIPIRQQTNSGWAFNNNISNHLFDRFHLRVGAGLRF